MSNSIASLFCPDSASPRQTTLPSPSEPGFFRELEGVRGFAFLAVFFAHYVWIFKAANGWSFPKIVDAAMELAYVTVPVFFVLSGFLITRILMKTRDRQGYFRTFYLRRVVRILPLYYLMFGLLGVLRFFAGATVPFYVQRLLFVSNLSAGSMADVVWRGHSILTGHLWSLCMEEQFYLLWPVALWLCRSQRSLKALCFSLLGLATMFRLAWPLLHKAPSDAYFHSVTRFDALVLGALMAVYFESAPYRRLEGFALQGAVLGGVTLMVTGFFAGTYQLANTTTYWREMCLIPLINVMALLTVMAVMRPGSRLQSACQGKTITRLGSMTYGAYMFHLLYVLYFMGPVRSSLMAYMPPWLGAVVSMLMAFALTLGLAYVAYEWVEKPGMRLKKRIQFGPQTGEAPHAGWVFATARKPLVGFAWLRPIRVKEGLRSMP